MFQGLFLFPSVVIFFLLSIDALCEFFEVLFEELFSILCHESDLRLHHDVLLLILFSILYDASNFIFHQKDLVLECFSILYNVSDIIFDKEGLTFLFLVQMD